MDPWWNEDGLAIFEHWRTYHDWCFLRPCRDGRGMLLYCKGKLQWREV